MENEKELINGIGASAEKALDFIEKAVAGPLMEGTGIFTDKVKFWRFKNQVNIIIKAKEFLTEKGIKTPKKIPIKDLTTLLEYASFEEEEIMIDSWSNLLTNTLNPNNHFNSCHVFSQILNQISINEIYIINHMYNQCFIQTSEHRPYFEIENLINSSHTNYQSAYLLIDNLMRLRILEEKPPKLKYSDRRVIIYNPDEEVPDNELIKEYSYRLSKFGVELYRQIQE